MSYEVKAGDRVRLTFTWEGSEHVITGVAKDPLGGGLSISRLATEMLKARKP